MSTRSVELTHPSFWQLIGNSIALTALSAKLIRKENIMADTLSKEQLQLLDAYWRAANYLSVGQIYLYDNPLLKQAFSKKHIKPRLLGHWGATRA